MATKKWRENNFSENAILCFMQKFKIAAKNGWKKIFGKSRQMTADTLGVKNFVKIVLSGTVFVFYAEAQDGRQK